MNNLKKRCLTLLLSLAMIVTYMPVGMIAYAEDDPAASQNEQLVDAGNPVEEVTPKDTVQEEPKTEDVQSEDVTSEETATPEGGSSEEALTPADEQPMETVETEEPEEELKGDSLEAKSTHYKVSISYGADAKIPEGSTLDLTEFPEGSAKYEEAKKELLKDELGNSPFSDFDENATDEDLEGLGMAAFDLTIRDKDGNVVEPAKDAKVQVNVELTELPEGVDAQTLADSMEIQHLNESSGDVVVEKVATSDEEEASTIRDMGEIEVNTVKETASTEFSVDGFSTYTMTWNYGGSHSITVHYVDTNGNSVTPTRTPTFTDDDMFLIYDVEGYEYDSTHYGSLTGTSITPLVRSEGGWGYYSHNRQYYNNGWNNLERDIYVVYKKKATPPTGGTPAAPSFDGETWPDAPEFTKTSKNAGNGTNTISLTVTAPEKPVSKGAKADVIVVFDVSGSMNDNISSSDRTDRIDAAKDAVNTMAEKLLGTAGNDVRMALVPFSTTGSKRSFGGQDFTNSNSTYQSAVNSLTANGGTNWEQALRIANNMAVANDRATFIVFVTDGDPTFRISRGNVSDDDLDMNSGENYQFYRNNNIFGTGSTDPGSRNFEFAVEEVKAIKASNKQFYAVGVSADVTKVQNLTTQGGYAADHAFLATSTTALNNAINSITSSIQATLGAGDIEMTDGITALTNAEMKVMQTVDPNSFKYYRYGGENNKYGNGYANKTEWTTRQADGCGAATYNETKGAVEWNMGETFQLEDDVTYVVEFTVWPSQAAYDLVADLNNGIRTFDSLTPGEKAQVVEVTPPTATTTGSYALRTNTDELKATYSQTSTSGNTTTISGEEGIEADFEVHKEDMALTSDYITVEKKWNNELDSRVVDGIDLTVTKDGTPYISDITLNDDNSWISEKEYISAGLITKTSDGRYNVREKGHDYTVTEPVEYSYYWDLTADTYRPMVIDGTLHVLIKDDNPSGAEGTAWYTIDGKKYRVADGSTNLVATNDRRSNLNLSKTVDAESNPDPDALFTYKITVTSKNGADVWFGAQDKDGNTVSIPTYSANVTPGTGTSEGSYSVHSGESFTITVKDGWNVRFFNLPTGSSYSIEETTMPDGYGFKSVTSSADKDGASGTISGQKVTGDIDKPNNIYQTAYTNKIVGAVAEPEVTKNLSGRDWTDTDEFEFTLTPVDGAPMPAGSSGSKTVKATKDKKTVSFGKILYPTDGEYKYTITEVKPANPIAGVVYDETPKNVTVNVTKQGDDLVAEVKYGDKDSLTVTNTLTPEKVNPEVTKTLEGREFKDDDSFTFTIARASGEPATTPLPSSTTATANKASNWKAVFGDMEFNAVGTYRYTITETKGSADGIAYNTAPVNVVVSITTDPETNKLVKSVEYDGKQTASVKNTFTPAKKGLEVTKILQGRAWEDGDEFEFTLAPVGDAPMPTAATAKAKKNDPATEENEEIAKFGEITFEKAGTYRYTITESKGTLDGVTYDTAPKTVVVTVDKNSETNALTVTSVKYNGQDSLSVTNTFTPSGEVPLQVTKAITGRDWEDGDEFTFTISKADGSPANTPMPANVIAKATKANHLAQFGAVKFTKEGTYTYNVVETKGSADGIAYDTTTHTITVVVTKDAQTNELKTAVTYDGKTGTGLTVTNPFTPTDAEIEASKAFDRWDIAESFTFELTPVGGAPMPADAVEGKVSKIVTQNALTAKFGKIVFDKAGDYKYNVTEVNDGVDGVTYDTTPHEVTVKVVKDKDTNALSATVDYGKDGKIEITNTFTSVKDSIKVTKDFGKNDWAKAGDGFVFELKALDGAPMPAGVSGATMTGTATKANPVVNFGDITYEAAGTYNYTITEQNGGADGVTYDTTEHTVTVTVSKDKDTNELSISIVYDGKEGDEGKSLTVKNDFAPTEEPIDVTKLLTGRDWTNDDEFEFTLKAVTEGAPMPAANGIADVVTDVLTGDNSRTVTVKKSSKDYTESFGTITFEKSGTYEYTITESKGTLDGVTYDTTEHTVTVKVSKDPETNALSAEVLYDGNKKKLEVPNEYNSTTTELQATKSFAFWGKADSFEFTLAPVGTAPMPAGAVDGKVAKTVTEDNPTALFGDIEYLKAGEYKYTITETKGDADGVTYDTTPHEVVVTVTRDPDTNALSAVAKYDGANALTITNTFESSNGITLQATKEFNDWGKASEFEFTLTAEGEAPLPEGAVDGKVVKKATKAAPTAVFGSVTFDAVGTYTYKVKETKGDADGVTYDTSEHTIVVTVSKDADNRLTATAVYDGDKDKTAVVITNTYSESDPISLEATKEFNDWGKANQFTFELRAVDGSPMPEGTVDGVKSATATRETKANFGNITYPAVGEYKYTITEVDSGVEGVKYDTTPKNVVVTVSKDNNNKLTATAKYEGKTSLTVTNTFEPAVTKEPIKVTKDFKDWGKADEFEFTLAAVTDGAPMPEGAANGELKKKATKAEPTAIFGSITYEKSGIYEYTITETNGKADGVSYDTKPHNVVVNVTKGEGNKLTATVTYDGKTSLTVTNTYEPAVTEKPIEVTKSFNDWGKAESFTFNIKAVTQGAPMPAKTSAVATKDDPDTELNETIAQFGKITFEKAGRYEYEITEVNDGADGVSYDTTAHKVVVEVNKAEDATNKLTATVTYDGKPSLTVTNIYEPAVTKQPIQATKNFSDWGQAESFTFVLEAKDNAPMPAGAKDGKLEKTATEGAPTAIFGNITYEKADTYKYTITELDDGVDGVTYDTSAHEVVVTVTKADDATNKLTAEVKYDGGTALTITNSYDSGKATLQATKAFEDWGKADSFEFTLEAKKNAPMPAGANNGKLARTATESAPTAVFGQIEYNKAGTYEYTITESNGGVDGVSYDTTPHNVVVTVVKGAGNKLTATVKYDGKDSLTIENTFTPVETKDSIKATKEFKDWGKADSFTFTLKAITKNAPMPEGAEGDELTKTATKANTIADFGKITYEKVGVYEYTITEKNDGIDGVSYDTTPHKVTVTVTKANNATNKLSAEVKYDDNKDSLTITNTFNPVTTKTPVQVTKEFNDWGKADEFTFDLEAKNNAPMPEGATDGKLTKKATKDNKTAVFGNITFEKAGKYEYTITERNGGVDGVSYDTAPHTVVIEVVKANDATNALSIKEVTYDGGKDLKVTNTYTSLPMPTDQLLKVTKELKGRDWLDKETFDFTLAAGTATYTDGTTGTSPMPAGNGNKASATKDAPAVFGQMTFEKTGTYQYTITENNDNKGGITYDTKSYDVTVVIGKVNDNTNALKVDSVTYDGDKDSLTVTNTYKAEGTAEFDAKKILKGRELKAGEFTFELKQDGVKVGEAKNDAEGKVTFEGVKFVIKVDDNGEVIDQTGEYEFTISEVEPTTGKLGGVTYDKTVAKIKVDVTDNHDGTLGITYDDKAKAPTPEFTNTYEAEGKLELKGLKTLEYGDLTEQAFNFKVLDASGKEVATAVAGGKGATVTGDANTKAGTKSEFKFSEIKYVIKVDESGKVIDQTGDYTYTIKEVIPDEAVNKKTGKTYKEDPAADGIFELGNYRYDNSEKTVKVKVSDNGDGSLKVEQTEGDAVQSFTNTKAYTEVEITKDLKNYVQHKGVKEVTLAFRVVDKETKGSKFSAAGGITFTQAEVESGEPKKVTIAKIPTDIPVEVTEVYASNFKPGDDPSDYTVELKLEDGVYKASFTNTFDDVNYNSGIINNYKKNADGEYEHQKN